MITTTSSFEEKNRVSIFLGNMGRFCQKTVRTGVLSLIPISLWSWFHFFLSPSLKDQFSLPLHLIIMMLVAVLLFWALIFLAAFYRLWVPVLRAFRVCLLYACLSTVYQLFCLYKQGFPFISLQVWFDAEYREAIFSKAYTYTLSFDARPLALIVFGLILVLYSLPIFGKVASFTQRDPARDWNR